MPTYVYKFLETGETLEVQQSFADDTLTEAVHPRTGATMAVKKVFQPVGVTFKGDGFYKTDNRGTSKAGATASGESSGSDSSSDTRSDSGAGKPATADSAGSSGDKKTAATPSTTSSTESKPSSSDTKSTGGSSTTKPGTG